LKNLKHSEGLKEGSLRREGQTSYRHLRGHNLVREGKKGDQIRAKRNLGGGRDPPKGGRSFFWLVGKGGRKERFGIR